MSKNNKTDKKKKTGTKPYKSSDRYKGIQAIKRPVETIKHNYNEKTKGSDRYLIWMLLRNGDWEEFTAYPEDGSFKHNGCTYVVDESVAEYIFPARMYRLIYHQDISAPVRLRIDSAALKKASIDTNKDVDIALNPAVIAKFTEAKIVESMIQGAELQEWFRKVFIAIVAILVVSAVHLALWMHNAGILSRMASAVPGTG